MSKMAVFLPRQSTMQENNGFLPDRQLVPGNGGAQRILSQLPYAISMQYLMTGDSMDAKTVAHWGLVNQVAPQAELMATAMPMAHRIAANAPLAVQAPTRRWRCRRPRNWRCAPVTLTWPPACAWSRS